MSFEVPISAGDGIDPRHWAPLRFSHVVRSESVVEWDVIGSSECFLFVGKITLKENALLI